MNFSINSINRKLFETLNQNEKSIQGIKKLGDYNMGFLNFNGILAGKTSLNYFNNSLYNAYTKNDFSTIFSNRFNNIQPQYNENLKLRANQPEVASEADLPEDELIRLKQSPARQELSKILHQCDDKVFNCLQSDCDNMNIIADSGLAEQLDVISKFDKISISKTQKIISIIQGIDSLDTKNMTEAEMEAKVKEYNEILENAKNEYTQLRELLEKGAALAKIKIEKQNKNKDFDNEDFQSQVKEIAKGLNELEQKVVSEESENAAT